MARLRTLEVSEFDEDLRAVLPPAALDARRGELGALQVWAQRPDVAIAWLRFSAALAAASELPARLVELVRLRVAFHNQCRSCMAVRSGTASAQGLDDDLVCQLEAPEEAPDLTAAERAALAYADLVATRHLDIDDAVFDRLREHFTEPEIIELGAHVGVFVGFGRVAMSWDLVDDLPERFHDREGAVTPWGDGARTVAWR